MRYMQKIVISILREDVYSPARRTKKAIIWSAFELVWKDGYNSDICEGGRVSHS